jgi:protein-tyrosine phosphatase
MMRHLVAKEELSEEIIIASCGIGDWHIGRPPDARIREAATLRGIALNTRAKPFVPNYLDEYDYILVADESILEYLLKHAKNLEQKSKIHYMTAYSKAYKNIPVPDPYYEGVGAFEHVLDILEDSCLGLLEDIKTRLKD